MTHAAFAAARACLPDVPALVVGAREAVWIEAGANETLTLAAAAERLRRGAAPVVCHARVAARRLHLPAIDAHDVLELFAFVRPGRFCVPTPRGLADALLLTVPQTREAQAQMLLAAARALLAELTASPGRNATAIARTMARGGWRWAPSVLAALGSGSASPGVDRPEDGMRVWLQIKDWEDRAGEAPPDSRPVEPVEARARLVQLLGVSAEPRPQQLDYASRAAAAFMPRDRSDEPRVVLAEAGTGIGKTLGYIAPATLWAQKNHGAVWISTYTRNLQRQLDQELDRAYPDLRDKGQKVIVRKGRENLFCLLNYEEALERLSARREDATALGLVARWALATRDGDMVGGDFPAWLADLLGAGLTLDLTDTRGECIYGACRHYRRCFVERAIRRARRAEIVVANHALVIIQAARSADEHILPTRYVFDEGHQLFDAADETFSLHLSGRETAELRRWLRGAEDGGRQRRRGLKDRAFEMIGEQREAATALDEALVHARGLPGPGWRARLAAGTPMGPAEAFLALVRQQVYARSREGELSFSLETEPQPAVPGLIEAASTLEAALGQLARPLRALVAALVTRLDDEAETLDTAARQRIDGLRRSIQRRASEPLAGWRSMLRAFDQPQPEGFFDWLSVERAEGRELDVGLCRHWIDPMRPFADIVLRPAHGALITSATLRDGTGDAGADWAAAEHRTGARHLNAAPERSALSSPFDYAACTRVIVVTDVARDDVRQVAAAYRTLFVAANGGGLGLFTAISRLRAVHAAIAQPLEEAGLGLLAQHVDPLDVGSLIDIFRAEEDTCLLGTDAVRDGIDVPGRSLRLIVFDRVPWPRPSLLHRARREAMGGRRYDEMLVRLKLKQAYGRLIRRAGDRGVFVMLDRQLPSRLSGAFPDGVSIRRLGLAEAIAETRALLSG
ncbi:MAG: ATP-dependent DNA helicase [Rhodospirillales bacterium]|nr:ATP-dependent DNA helicase [Rhodospirillales bacterium]